MDTDINQIKQTNKKRIEGKQKLYIYVYLRNIRENQKHVITELSNKQLQT